MNSPSPDNVQALPVANIRPNPRNPRKLGLDTASIAEMLRSIEAEGLLEPVLVRVLEATPLAGTFYELIAGERRWRAFVMKKSDTIPARVLEADEATAAAKCLVGFLQSKSATPLEEGIGYRRALALTDRTGAAVFTVAELSRRTGKLAQTIHDRMLLTDLPAAGQTALLAGSLAERSATMIARLPEAAAQEECLKRVLSGNEAGQPYTVEGVQSLIREEYSRDLRGAPFDRKDPELLRAAGPCETCPHRTGANPDRFGECKGGAANVCMRPDCYRAKVEASRVRVAEKLMDEGVEVLDAEASEREFPAGHKGLRFDSPYVVLGANVPEELLKKEVAAHGAVTWAELLRHAPAQAPQVAAFDQAGDVVRLVERKLAIAAVDADEKKHLFKESDQKKTRITAGAVGAPPRPSREHGAGSEEAVVDLPVAVDGPFRKECQIAVRLIEDMRSEAAGWGKRFSAPLQVRLDAWLEANGPKKEDAA